MKNIKYQHNIEGFSIGDEVYFQDDTEFGNSPGFISELDKDGNCSVKHLNGSETACHIIDLNRIK